MENVTTGNEVQAVEENHVMDVARTLMVTLDNDQRAKLVMLLINGFPTSGDGYPATVAECIRPNIKFIKGVIPALKKFKDRKAFGTKTNKTRLKYMQILVKDFAEVYNVEPPTVEVEGIDLSKKVKDTNDDSGSSSYSPATKTITMRGKLSIITVLHEFAHHLGKNERLAAIWSINLFRKVYPNQFAKLNAVGHTLRRNG